MLEDSHGAPGTQAHRRDGSRCWETDMVSPEPQPVPECQTAEDQCQLADGTAEIEVGEGQLATESDQAMGNGLQRNR